MKLMSVKTKKTMMLSATIVEPIGNVLPLNPKNDLYKENVICKNIAVTKHKSEIIAEEMVTDLNVLNILIDVKAGKIISAETSNEPTSFIAITMMIAITIATIKLYTLVLTPVARAKPSSNVMAKIL